MKKILALLLCALAALSSAACSCSKRDDRSDREIKLTQPSRPSEVSLQEEEEEDEEESDLTANFVHISKLDELPEYITNNPQLYSKLLENMLKLYYAAILAGRVNSDNYAPRYCEDRLPPKSASPEERRTAAEHCTVGGALEYFGYDNKNYMKYYEIYNGCLPYFCFDRNGGIYLKEEVSADNIFPMTGYDYPLYNIFRYANTDKVEREALAFAASEMSHAVNEYYYGIKNGSVTSSKKLKYTSDRLPQRGADESEKNKCAGEATIAGALDFAGCYTSLYPCITKLGYNKSSEIFTLPDLTDTGIISIGSSDTKLSVLYGG